MQHKILVLNGRSYAKALIGLGDIEYYTTSFFKDPESFGLVLFTGGEDVTPEWYGERSPHHMCYYNTARDKEEREVFSVARENNIRCIGICRGVQFLNVMAGGKMYHDVDNHAGKHHEVETLTGEIIRVNSLHHQMVIPPENANIIAWAKETRSTRYYGNDDKLVPGPEKEPEAVLFPKIESAGVQWHPEMLSETMRGSMWFYELVKDLLHMKDFSEIVNKYTGEKCQQFRCATVQ